MSGFQYFSQRSLRSSGTTFRALPLCSALGEMKPKPDTTIFNLVLTNASASLALQAYEGY
jgi:hypothetical protein